MVVAIVVSSLGTHRFIPYFSTPPQRRLTIGRIFMEMAQTLKNRSFFALTISALFSAIAAGTLASLNFYFNTFFWGLTAQQILYLNVFTIIAPTLAVALAPAFSSRLGKKAAAMTLWILATIFYWFPMAARLLGAFPRNGDPLMIPLLAVLQVIGTLFSIACSITLSSMMADVVEDSQRVTGRRSEGLFFSANAFVLKAVSGMGILVATQLLALVHFPAHADPKTLDPKIPADLALAYFPVTFTLYAIALGCLSFYKISRASHEENVRRLAAEAEQTGFDAGLAGVRTPEHGDPAEQAAG
jgi:glycoside/pentoside/hexuronide:cation symporter, GPH family